MNPRLTLNQKQERILPLIQEQMEILTGLGNPTREEAKAQADEYADVDLMEALADIMDKDGEPNYEERQKFMDKWQESHKAHHAYQQIDRFMTTLTQDLVKMSDCKYIVFQATGEGLQSPAGYHPDENVFVVDREVILGVNDLKDVPQTNFDLAYIEAVRD
jgi:hypothetical protein